MGAVLLCACVDLGHGGAACHRLCAAANTRIVLTGYSCVVWDMQLVGALDTSSGLAYMSWMPWTYLARDL